jgi:DeoR/GlpR family transcriptional regulator of sugar metabolism
VQKYESSIRLTNLANTYNMSKSTIRQLRTLYNPFLL